MDERMPSKFQHTKWHFSAESWADFHEFLINSRSPFYRILILFLQQLYKKGMYLMMTAVTLPPSANGARAFDVVDSGAEDARTGGSTRGRAIQSWMMGCRKKHVEPLIMVVLKVKLSLSRWQVGGQYMTKRNTIADQTNNAYILLELGLLMSSVIGMDEMLLAGHRYTISSKDIVLWI
ncbi:hypothetical protein POM88_006119 [Heracleum sosnowskyi]|uniref:Uncharacterized protein n=1 Tax=Heracleum sosnowskyi TaxID=360622 RepID=A0AAD8N528_9APIA|nr:hypothetical protein POM88_006119 [Heracleum sosnowskyi]